MSSGTSPMPSDANVPSPSHRPEQAVARRRIGPVLALLLLSPIISELLSGSVRLSTIFVLIPATGVWGCAALLIREVVRRRRGTYGTMLLLGLALAIAEECIIQQTSLAPLIGIDPAKVYSRAFGVNWEYFLWALGFESVWAVVVPIALAEMLFPERRLQPWLGRTGIIVSIIALVLSSFAAWYSWTQVMLPKLYPNSVYHVPMHALVAALVAIAVLIGLALVHQPAARDASVSARPVPHPWVIGICAFAMAFSWFLQVMLAFSAMPQLPPTAALAAGCGLAALAWWLFHRWCSSLNWCDGHMWAVVFGTIVATMLGGYITVAASGALVVDRVAHVAFNLIALALLFRWSVRNRTVLASASAPGSNPV